MPRRPSWCQDLAQMSKFLLEDLKHFNWFSWNFVYYQEKKAGKYINFIKEAVIHSCKMAPVEWLLLLLQEELMLLAALVAVTMLQNEENKKRKRKKQPAPRRFWVQRWIARRVQFGDYEHLMQELAMDDPDTFRNFQRIN